MKNDEEVLEVKTFNTILILWIEKLGWDDPVSFSNGSTPDNFPRRTLSAISAPRWLGLSTNSKVGIHEFRMRFR